MENDLLSPIRLLFCGADVYMFYRFFSVLFSSKRKGRKIILISLALTITIFFENSVNNPTMNLIILPLLFFIYVMLIFQISVRNGVVYVIIFFSFMANRELVCILIYRLLEKNLPFYFPPWYTSGGIYFLMISYLIGFIYLLCIEKFIRKLEIGNNNNFSFYLLINPILSYLVTKGFIYSDFPESMRLQVLICITSIIFWLTNAVIFIVLEKYTNIMNKIKYSELYTIKRKMENDHFQKVLKINDHYRCYMHDIHAYFNSFRMLALNNENKKIVKIIDELDGEIQEKTSFDIYSSNSVLNAILTERIAMAKEKGVELTLFVEKFLKVDFISDADIISMFGNILDNAIEAAGKCSPEKRKVNVKLFMGTDYFMVFYIQNSYSISAKREGTRLLSTKTGSSQHGLGIGIVKSLVDKYGGTLNLEEKEDFFVTTLTISTYTRENNHVI